MGTYYTYLYNNTYNFGSIYVQIHRVDRQAMQWLNLA